jgi:probable HAF family extracellular repeat protein
MCFSVAVLGACTAHAQQTSLKYSLTDLGTLGGILSVGGGINASGQVTGYSLLAGGAGATHAFLFSNGAIHDLGALNGVFSSGNRINSAGQITGYSQAPDGSDTAFIFSNGVMSAISALDGRRSIGRGINSSGQVVGDASVPGASGWNPYHAFLYTNGVVQDLPTLGGTSSSGVDVNDAGEVTGWANTSSEAQHAFVYRSGQMVDIDTLGSQASIGIRINASGQITGSATNTSGASHAFHYSEGVMQDLGTLGGQNSAGYDINAAGDIVGFAELANGDRRAFIRHNGVITDLNTLVDPVNPLAAFLILDEATGINDQGVILANGYDSQRGERHPYLLTPQPALTLSVNPASISLGNSATVAWTASNVADCAASGAWSGIKTASGSEQVTPVNTGTNSYTLTCVGVGGTVTKSADLAVTAAVKPTASVSVSPSVVAAGAASPTLTWSSTNALTCTADGAWSGSQALTGSVPLANLQPGSYTYSLTCTGVGGSVTSSAALQVTAVSAGKAGGGGPVSLLSIFVLAGLAAARQYFTRAKKSPPKHNS